MQIEAPEGVALGWTRHRRRNFGGKKIKETAVDGGDIWRRRRIGSQGDNVDLMNVTTAAANGQIGNGNTSALNQSAAN